MNLFGSKSDEHGGYIMICGKFTFKYPEYIMNRPSNIFEAKCLRA